MLKRLFLFILVLCSFTLRGQTLLSDTVLDVNCYHDGGIYTTIASLNTNVFTKWYYSQDTTIWDLLDTSSTNIYLNNSNLNSDSITTTICGYYKLEIVNVFDTILDERFYHIDCMLSGVLQVVSIQCHNDLGNIRIDSIIGGKSPYAFSWFDNNIITSDTSNFIDSLSEGIYTTVITDDIGCKDTIITRLYNPDILLFDTIIINDVSCHQELTGSLFFTVYGGRKITETNKYSYYLISGNDTVAQSDTNYISPNLQQNSISSSLLPSLYDSVTITSLPSDTFRLLILDSSFCVIDTNIYINQPDSYVLHTSSNSSPILCSSDTTWFIIDSITGGNFPFLYWVDGISLINFSDSSYINDSIFIPGGDYNLYINDTINLCQETLEFSIISLYDVNVEFSLYHVLCFGDSSGSILVDSVFGGLPPYNINSFGVNMDSLASGIYNIEIIDSLSCIFRDTFIIYEPPSIVVDAIVKDPLCFGDSNGSIDLNILGGVSPYEVLWNNGVVDTILSNVYAGIYSFLVSDSNNCHISDTISIINPDLMTIEFHNYSDSLFCFGDSTIIEVIVNGYDSIYSVLWFNNDTLDHTTISAGLAYCNVVDNNNCHTTDSINIYQPDTFLILDVIIVDTVCNDGVSIYVETIGGTPPIQYEWSTGDTLNSIVVHDSLSICWVIATDSCGNSDSTGVNIVPFVLETSLYYNDSSHIAHIEIENTTSSGPFLYVWDNLRSDSVGIDSFLLINPCEEIYYVSIIDSTNGCFVLDTINAYLYLPDSLVNLNHTSVIPDSSLWGFGPYTYLWDNGAITSQVIICPGNHWVEVTDNSSNGLGCMVRQDFVIDPLLISIEPSGILVECDLENIDINLQAIASGGTPPYTYEWSLGSTSNPLTISVSPGSYSVTVIDKNGCLSDTVFIIEPMTSDCVPNVFSPNGDNINDTWNLEDIFLFEDTEIKVFGRFGRILFHSVGYNTPWDGKNKLGNDVPSGVYFYSINLGNGLNSIKGTLTIIR